MKRALYSALFLATFSLGLGGIFTPTALAAVTVTPATGGTNISSDNATNATSPQFTTLGNIVIAEPSNGKGNIGNGTFTIQPPTGWNFNTTGVITSVTGSLSVAVTTQTATLLTLTISGALTNTQQSFTIIGLQARATNGATLPNSGDITRAGGSANINGANAGAILGSLSQVSGAVSASNSTISANPISASTDGGAQTTITITAKDQFNNPISGASVTLSSSGTGNTLTQPASATNASGQTTGAMSSTKAESKTISAVVGGTPITQTASVNFTVGALDHIMITPSGAQSVGRGSTLSFSAQGFDINNNSITGLTYTWAVVAGTGTGSIASDGVLTGGNLGTLTVTATSGAVTGSSGSVTVTNTAPTANNQTVSIDEDTSLPITLTGADTNGDTLTYSIVSNPTHGTLSGFNASTGAVTYNPSVNYNGADSFTFKTNDGAADSSAATISITVNAINDSPSLTGIGNKSVNENQALAFTMSATDPDGDTLTYSVTNLPSGAAYGTNTGSFSWTPNYNQAGTYTAVHFSVTDGTFTASEDINITVNNANQAPILGVIGNKTGSEDSELTFVISATDGDGDALTYSATNLPTGATFNTNTQTFAWTPSFVQSGNYSVIFTVADATLNDSENVAIDIGNVNRTPSLNAIGNKTVSENSALNFTVSATDPDSDTLTYSATNLPSGASFNTGTGEFSWTPNYNQSGTYADIHFEVTDGSVTDFENITVTVSNTNRAPILNSIGDKTANENSELTFALSASDSDGDAITYSATNLPSGATFSTTTNTFAWTPSYDQSGTYSAIHFSVTDGGLSAGEDIAITVANINRSPSLNSIGNKSTDENTLLQFTVSASDPDSDTLIYSVSNLPTGAVFATSTGIFSWTPTYDQAGTFSAIHFETTDGTATASEDITITVANTNRAPGLNSIGNKTGTETSELTFVLSASDADGDAITYSATNLPSGATFNAGTRTFTWTPSYNQSGTYSAIHFSVTDGALSGSEDISVSISDSNHVPALTNIGNRNTDENQTLSFTVSATDADGDTLTYSASNLPSGASFNANSGAFSWKPTFDQSGDYAAVHFEVTDGAATASEDISIAVKNINQDGGGSIIGSIGGIIGNLSLFNFGPSPAEPESIASAQLPAETENIAGPINVQQESNTLASENESASNTEISTAGTEVENSETEPVAGLVQTETPGNETSGARTSLLANLADLISLRSATSLMASVTQTISQSWTSLVNFFASFFLNR